MNELQLYLSTGLNLTNIRLKKGSCAWMSIVCHLFKAQESTKQWFVSFQYVSSKSIKTYNDTPGKQTSGDEHW